MTTMVSVTRFLPSFLFHPESYLEWLEKITLGLYHDFLIVNEMSKPPVLLTLPPGFASR